MPPAPPQTQGPVAASGALSFEVLAEIAAGATARVDLCRVLASGSAPPGAGSVVTMGETPKPPAQPLMPTPRPGTLVAVKRLHPHVAEDPTFVKQFLDEVRFTYWLRHPNVVEVAGWGTDAEGSYLAVELVQGVSLLRLMKTIFDTGEAFTERMVVYIASRICWGLGAAHSLRAPDGEMLNLVHRDLTPSNVLVGFNGEVKITDFGLAKAKQRLTKTLTGMKKGEPTYMAPEQARSDEIDARADLFSLGVVLFELFAGRRPWIAKSDYEMVQITSREPPADLKELRPKIDRELVNLVNRCLERDPASRYQSAREIALRLDEWLTVHGYQEDNEEALGRFVRRNAMRQMRWFERAIAGDLSPHVEPDPRPRVPTYTEHTRPRSEPPPPKTPPPPPPRGPAKPLVPPRPQNAPADPRSIRAANVVQQLKKLAPPVEPVRPAKSRRTPTLDDEDSDATDVELRIGPHARQQAAARALPDLVPEGDESGEEDPTLVQKGDDQVQAMRAAARAKRGPTATVKMPPTPGVPRPPSAPPPPPSLIVDEESDQRTTEVKRAAEQRAAQRAGVQPASPVTMGGGPPYPPPQAIADPESDLPTAPLAQGRRATGTDQPAPVQIGKITPVNIGAPVETRSRGRGGEAPAVRAIPPSPDVPRRPEALPSPRQNRTTQPAMRAVIPAAPPAPVEPFHGASAAPRAPEPVQPVISPPVDPARISHTDDVQAFDRSALQRGSGPMTEEAVIAEADRLAIEAVRRNEEARAAQVRAERKAASAKMAGEAAAIAADALRLLKTSGLAAAVQRLEEAKTLDASVQSGKIPIDAAAQLRSGVSSFPGPISSPPSPRQPEATSSGSSHPSGQAYAAGAPFAGAMAAPPPPTSSSVPIFAGAAADPAPIRPSHVPPAPDLHPSVPPAAMAGPGYAAPGAVDPEAFRARLRPSLLGTPSGALVALALVGLGVVVTLVLLLAK